MSWKGENYRMERENFGEGIDGSSSIAGIKNGYMLEAYNVDICQEGRVQKRPGYHVFAQRLPIRTKETIQNGSRSRVILDVIPEETVTLSLYANTAQNATVTQSSLFYRADDSDNTIFATFSSTEEITEDTLLRAIGDDGQEHFVQPIVVFQSTGTVKLLLPIYVKNWWTGVSLSDTLAVTKPFQLSQGVSLFSFRESSLSGLAVIDAAPNSRVKLDFASDSEVPTLELGASVLFETCIRKADGSPVVGTVTHISSESVTVEVEEPTGNILGAVSFDYFRMRYINQKHLYYKSQTRESSIIGDLHPATGTFHLAINDCCSFSVSTSVLDNELVSMQEIGFLYGTGIKAGPVNILGKYFEIESGQDKIMCGIDGHVFSETAHPKNTVKTVEGLVYTGPSTGIYANITDKTISIPLPNADKIYQPEDMISFSFAEGTNGRVITETLTCHSATSTHLILQSNDRPSIYVRQYTKFSLTRRSKTVLITGALNSLPLVPGMSVQYGGRHALLPVCEILEVNYSGQIPYVVLDTELFWSSDDVLTYQPLFLPVRSDCSCSFATKPGERVEINTVTMERSTIIASGLSGIWRFNGKELLNLRIPRVGSGYIRNVPGTGGALKLDTQEDGTKTGRRYDFIVTYQYSELINGKLVVYESGLSPVSNFRILSQQDDLKSSYSRIVELQIPCVPRGIGLPADDIFINVYRIPSGTQLTEPSAEAYLLERQVKNVPDAPFLTVIAGTEQPFLFNESNYKVLYASVTGDAAPDELKREIVDPPLSPVVSTLENRIVAASGFDHPQIHFICKDVYSTVDNLFAANFEINHTPRQLLETAHKFFSAPCDISTTSSTGGINSIPFQVVGVTSYDIKKITFTDNSHLFKVSGVTITNGNKYLLRLANGKKEALEAGTADSYFMGYDFNGQMFEGTATSQELQAQKKWTRRNSNDTVNPPTEGFLVFEKLLDVTNISPTNGLVVVGTNVKDAKGVIDLLLYTTATLSQGNYIILKGLGTTGQIRNTAGVQLSFDRDLILKVMNGSSPYQLKAYISGNSVDSHFAEPAIQSAVSVSNAVTGVVCEPFTIYRLMSTSAASSNSWSVTPRTATIQLTTSPAITPSAGDYVCVDGLPSEVPAGSGFRYNGSLEVVSFAGDTFVVKVSPPESARGVLTQDFTSVTPKGRLVWTKGAVLESPNVVQLRLTPTVLTVPVQAGDYPFVVFKGEDSDAFCLALTGWFPVTRVTTDFVTWTTSLAVGQTIAGVEFDYKMPLDFAALTGASFTRVVFASRTGDGLNTQRTLNIPVPVLKLKDGSRDICGILYSAIDGYTPLERVIKPLSHAMNCVLRNEGFAYWGGHLIGNVEGAHPGNVIPVNGVKFMRHLHGENYYKYRYYRGNIVRKRFEPEFLCQFASNYWRVEGSENVDVVDPNPLSFTCITMYRPSRLWYTNPTGTLVGQSFRELSFDDVESQDGERIIGMAPFQTYSILAKQNSMWKLSFGNSATLSRTKIPGVVGATSHRNMVAMDRGVFFLHDTGVYVTDGTVCESIHRVKRHFEEHAVQNRELFPLASGYHNAYGKNISIGIPFSMDADSLTDVVDAQFSIDYSLGGITMETIGRGWYINTHLEAIAWQCIHNDVFFSSPKGSVFRVRTERGPTFYSDERRPIPFLVRTRFVLGDSQLDGRFIRGLYFQFGKQTNVNMDVGLAVDYSMGYEKIAEYRMTIDGLGTTPFGTGYWGADRHMENQRKTPDKMRVYQFSLEFKDEALDSSGAVYGVSIQSESMSGKLVPQGGQKG